MGGIFQQELLRIPGIFFSGMMYSSSRDKKWGELINQHLLFMWFSFFEVIWERISMNISQKSLLRATLEHLGWTISTSGVNPGGSRSNPHVCHVKKSMLNPLNPTESHNIPLHLIAHLLYPHDIPPLHQLHLGSPGPGEALCISGSSRALPPAWSIEPHLWKNDGKMTMQHGIPWQPGSGYSIFKPRIWVEHGWAA